MNTKKILPPNGGCAASRCRSWGLGLIIGVLILVLGLLGIVTFFVKARGGSTVDTDDSSTVVDVVRPLPGQSAGGKKSNVGMHGSRKSGVARGGKRARGLIFDDGDDDRDELSPEDRRLLSVIEEGRDDDSLEKVLKVLSEASASTNVEVRSELVDALDSFGVSAMNHLLPFLADPDDDVRQSAIDSWTSSLGEVEDEKMKAGLITAVMQVMKDEDALESMTSELIGMDEKIALQVLVDVIEGGKASKQAVAAAKEQYEFLTGDEYTTVEAADKWLAENYEPPDQEKATDGN